MLNIVMFAVLILNLRFRLQLSLVVKQETLHHLLVLKKLWVI